MISYDLNEQLATIEDLEVLNKLGIDLKLDFILNHASVLSEQFQDIIKKEMNLNTKTFLLIGIVLEWIWRNDRRGIYPAK